MILLFDIVSMFSLHSAKPGESSPIRGRVRSLESRTRDTRQEPEELHRPGGGGDEEAQASGVTAPSLAG